jgi:type II secretory pathway component PulF
LADYIDRSYELNSKAKNALVYPGFIMLTFVVVMTLMLTVVIPKIGSIISDSGQELPLLQRWCLGMSHFMIDYGFFLIIALIIGGYFLFRYFQTPKGHETLGRIEISIPIVGALYKKLYLSRIADNMHVMLSSGISAVRSLEITGSVVGNAMYTGIMQDAVASVKAGATISSAFMSYPHEIPVIMVQMLQIGEETGELGNILQRLGEIL